MKPFEYYQGREQTYIKHYFLEKYLERLLFNVLSFKNEFVYVDGFSGPWQSEDEKLGDTSFAIAVDQLEKMRGIFERRGETKKFRCLFNELEPQPFKELEKFCRQKRDIETRPTNMTFEALIPEALDYIGKTFSLTFIDPTGWTGFSMKEIAPLLKLRGEVIINFMFDQVNRFWEDPDQDLRQSFDKLYGGAGWDREIKSLIKSENPRDYSILKVYMDRLKKISGAPHVTFTPILKPLSDRTYFYLVYITRSPKGLIEFRNVEEKVFHHQDDVRANAKRRKKLERTGQMPLWDGHDQPQHVRDTLREQKRQEYLAVFNRYIEEILNRERQIEYWQLLSKVLEIPFVFKSDVNSVLQVLLIAGSIECPNYGPRERVFKKGHIIKWLG